MQDTPNERMVLELVKDFLHSSRLMAAERCRPHGGLHIKLKGMPILDDQVELNMLGKLLFIGDEVIAPVNVNIYNNDKFRTDELMSVIINKLKNAKIEVFDFQVERHWYAGNVKRRYQNILFRGVTKTTDFNVLLDSYYLKQLLQGGSLKHFLYLRLMQILGLIGVVLGIMASVCVIVGFILNLADRNGK